MDSEKSRVACVSIAGSNLKVYKLLYSTIRYPVIEQLEFQIQHAIK